MAKMGWKKPPKPSKCSDPIIESHADQYDSCKSADKYISELKTSSRKFLRTEGKLRNKINPVRIAILDTGAHIPADEAEHVYNGRIKECRTWLRSTKDSGEALAGPCSDRDGHGTHGTSVLLQATENTKIEVFVAQIFDRSTEKVKQDSIIDDQTVRRIANVSLPVVQLCSLASIADGT
jgi:DNA transposition AAA+ family ATPase